MTRLIWHGATGAEETKPERPRGRHLDVTQKHVSVIAHRGCQKWIAVLTACLVLEMSSIWTCRSSISTSMDLRAFTAAAQVNSDSSSCTAIQHTQGKRTALKWQLHTHATRSKGRSRSPATRARHLQSGETVAVWCSASFKPFFLYIFCVFVGPLNGSTGVDY